MTCCFYSFIYSGEKGQTGISDIQVYNCALLHYKLFYCAIYNHASEFFSGSGYDQEIEYGAAHVGRWNTNNNFINF